MIPVSRLALVVGVAHRAELVAARRAAGEAHADHQRDCPACQDWKPCVQRARLRTAWDVAIAAEDASPPGSPSPSRGR